MDYENAVPLIGGSSRCTGELELYWDPKADPMLSGEILECEWPPFDIWAALTLGSVQGEFSATVSGSDITGFTAGGDGGLWMWDSSWTGVFDGMTLTGVFFDNTLFIDSCFGVFELTYEGS